MPGTSQALTTTSAVASGASAYPIDPNATGVFLYRQPPGTQRSAEPGCTPHMTAAATDTNSVLIQHLLEQAMLMNERNNATPKHTVNAALDEVTFGVRASLPTYDSFPHMSGKILFRGVRVVYADDAMAAMCGVANPQLLLGLRSLDFMVRDDKIVSGLDLLDFLFGDRRKMVSVERMRRFDGSLIWVRCEAIRTSVDVDHLPEVLCDISPASPPFNKSAVVKVQMI